MTRLFLSVRPPRDVLSELDACLAPLREDPPRGVRWMPAAQWHVTLCFLGRAQGCDVAAAMAGVELPRCGASLRTRPRTLGRVLVCEVAGLEELAGVVRGATAELGEPVGGHPFRGHLSVARLAKGAALPRGPAGPLVGPASLQWEPREVELVSSVTDPAGAVHEVVGTFSLAGGRSGGNA